MYRVFFLAALLFQSVAFSGTPKPAPTVDDLLHLQGPYSTPALSPGGDKIVFGVMRADFENDFLLEDLWMIDATSGEKQQLTSGSIPGGKPKWSPDGEWIAALGFDEAYNTQVVLIPRAGGEPRAVTASPHGVADFEWSPDGMRIAYIESERYNEADEDRTAEMGEYVVWEEDYRRAAIFVISVAEGLSSPGQGAVRVTGEDVSVVYLCWSPDQEHLAFAANPTPRWIDDFERGLFVLDLESGASRRVATVGTADGDCLWSADGREVLFDTISADPDNPLQDTGNTDLAVVSTESGETEVVTGAFDEHARLSAWKGNWIYFSAQQRTTRHLFRVNRESLVIERVTGPDEFYADSDYWESSFTFSDDGQSMAFLAGSPTSMAELFVSPVEVFSPRKLTDFTRQTEGFRFAKREVISWKSTDGLEIEGILFRAKDFDAARKHPLLIVVHGGPDLTERPTFVRGGPLGYPIDYWVGQGAVVLTLNYRGSGGYGQAFRELDLGEEPVKQMDDILSGIDHLVARGFIDEDRIGCTGWSHGGYLSAFLLTTSDRFAAISVGAGISNWETYYYNSWQYYTRISNFGADPFTDPGIYRRTSPMTFIKGAKTPTLIQHGTADRQVPVANAFELWRGLEDHGVENTLIVYPGTDHVAWSPKLSRTVMEQNVEFFDHYLFGGPKPDFVKRGKYAPPTDESTDE